MTNFIGYQVNGKVFFNTYLAYYESFKSGQPIYFNCLDDTYDQLDWTHEPEQSFEELMDAHAYSLRNSHERVILLWSGGTDSHTIYNVFKRNNIHIDEILIKHSAVNESYPESHVNWLLNNHWDSTTKITTIDEYDTELRSIVVDSEDWVWNNLGDMLKFGQSAVANHITVLCERTHNGHDWVAITGYEKPNLVQENGRWYTRQNDRILKQIMGHTRIHSFFLEPIINLKQSHMAKRVLKKLQDAGQHRNWSNYKEHRENGNIAYTAWARATGRHAELSTGVSYFQKRVNIGIMNTCLNSDGKVENFDPTGEKHLLSLLAQQDPTALRYVRGLYNLQSEKGFYEFLNTACLASPGAIFKTKQLWSKLRDLGT
jgi:hypothetical protein